MARRFGIEIECQMPNGMSHRVIAQHITNAGVLCNAEGYNHYTRQAWKVVPDGSLGYRGAEIVSPPLHSDSAGLAQVETVMRTLTALGCTVDVKCGMHVHIDAEGYGFKNLRNIAKCFVKFENFFDNIMPTSRRANNNRYIQSNRAKWGDYSDRSANSAMNAFDRAGNFAELYNANQAGSRYYKLNLEPIGRYNTVEFRQHSGSLDGAKATNWVRLLIAFVEQAAIARPRARNDNKTLSPAEDMQRFFAMFDVPADVRTFYMARRRELHRDPA